MRYLGIIVALAFAIGGAAGVFVAHDAGGWPIFAIGVIATAYLLTRPAAVAAPSYNNGATNTPTVPPAPSTPGPTKAV